jgi:hypothetical protein
VVVESEGEPRGREIPAPLEVTFRLEVEVPLARLFVVEGEGEARGREVYVIEDAVESEGEKKSLAASAPYRSLGLRRRCMPCVPIWYELSESVKIPPGGTHKRSGDEATKP